VAAIGLVLAVHGLLLVLISGSRIRPRTPAASIAFFGLWIEPSQPAAPTAPRPPPRVRSLAPRASATIPVPGAVEDASETGSSSTAISSPPTINWEGEAKAAGRRLAEPPRESATFSRPAETVRKPCEPPESSFVWNPELPRAGFTRTPIPLPFVRLGERCVVGLGFFGCNMGPLPEPNSHLFDDMKEGKTQESSVPEPNICD
jgi:hypothetical protein